MTQAQTEPECATKPRSPARSPARTGGAAPSTGRPRVSIITICKNAQDVIEETIASVQSQRDGSIEYIVIDGASTDGTRERIESRRDAIDTLVSEADSGVFEAMNKGASHATGDFLLFLNAGDTLLRPGTIRAAIGAIERAPHADVYHGDVVWFDPGSGRSEYKRAKPASRLNLYRGAISHQATLIRREAFERVGPYEESFRIGGDYEWSLRALHTHKLRFEILPVCVSVFMLGGLSSTESNRATMLDEFALARSRYYSRLDTLRIRAMVRFCKIFGI